MDAVPLFIVIISKKKNLFIPCLAVLFILHHLLFWGNSNFVISGYLVRFCSVDKNIQSPAPEKARRVIFADDPNCYGHYKQLEKVIGVLLKPSESFIDFTDTTFVYSAFGRECPVYVSQSPSMLSGEFSQEQFIAEIKKEKERLPVALFPLSSFYLSQYVDGVPLVLRHYKVAEYLYQNYRPLCTAGDYALWCDRDKYADYKNLLDDENSKSLNGNALQNDVGSLALQSCSVKKDSRGFLEIQSLAVDPFIDNFHTLINWENITFGQKYRMLVEYESSVAGIAQLFFKSGDDNYTEQNSIAKNVGGGGVIDFEVELEKDFRLRFDIPDDSTFSIKNIALSPVDAFSAPALQYGYDDGLGFHSYSMQHLAFLWANKDVKKAKNCPAITELMNNDGLVSLPGISESSKAKGNYIKLCVSNLGKEENLVLQFGNTNNGTFERKYDVSFTVRNGQHDYIVRPSIDYYWYTDEINAMKCWAGENINISAVSLLEGGVIK